MPTRWSAACAICRTASGRKVRVAVFAKGAKAEEAKKAGADIVGAEDLVETVNKGTIDFDRCIATPDMMGLVGRLGKVLGPRGLMPNPKVGTVTMDVTARSRPPRAARSSFASKRRESSRPASARRVLPRMQLAGNIKAFVDAVIKAKPPGAKGTYRQESCPFRSTMGPGLKLDLASVTRRMRASFRLGIFSISAGRPDGLSRRSDYLSEIAGAGESARLKRKACMRWVSKGSRVRIGARGRFEPLDLGFSWNPAKADRQVSAVKRSPAFVWVGLAVGPPASVMATTDAKKERASG